MSTPKQFPPSPYPIVISSKRILADGQPEIMKFVLEVYPLPAELGNELSGLLRATVTTFLSDKGIAPEGWGLEVLYNGIK